MPIWQSVDKPKSLEQLIIDVVLTPYGVDTANVSKESLQAFRKGADPLPGLVPLRRRIFSANRLCDG